MAELAIIIGNGFDPKEMEDKESLLVAELFKRYQELTKS